MAKMAINFLIDNWKEIVGIFLGLWGSIKYGIKFYIYVNGKIKPIRQWIDNSNKRDSDIADIKKLMLPNGGASLRDSIDRLEHKVDSISNRQTSLIKLSDNPMFECDSEGNCVSANNALCRLFGATESEMLGHGWASFLKDRQTTIKEWNDGLLSNAEITGEYTLYQGRDKTKEINVFYQAHIVRDEEDKIVGITGKATQIKT